MSMGYFILAMSNLQPKAQKVMDESTLIVVYNTLILA